jgi:hypothetical protein
MKFKILIALAVMVASLSAVAGEEKAKREMPSFSASHSMQTVAVVEAINHETRDVTLTGPDGNSVSFVASEEARNLNQVSVGDEVAIEIFEEVTITLVEGHGQQAGAGEMTGVARAEEGETPAGMAFDTVVVTATVEEINLEANTFKLKGPEGNVKQFDARDPENLKLAKVGDLVVITSTSAIALSLVEEASE